MVPTEASEARRRRAKWLTDHFQAAGLEIPEHIRESGRLMSRRERRIALAVAKRRAGMTPPHYAARPDWMSDGEWRAQKNAAKRVRRERG